MSNELSTTNANPNRLPDKKHATLAVEIQKAIYGQKLLDMNDIKQETFIIMSLRQAVILTQKKLSEERINVYCDELIKDIKRNFQWIAADELKLAIENGSKGMYGEIYELSYTQIFNWLKSYRDSDERKSVHAEAVKLEAEKKAKQLPPVEITREQHLREMAEIAFNIYKVKRNFILIPEDAFFYLEEGGFLKMPNDEKNAELEKVKKYLKTVQPANEWFEVLRNEPIKLTARKWVTGIYFEKLIQQGKQI